MSRFAILAEGALMPMLPKTATGILMYRTDEVAVVIDSANAGKDAIRLLELNLPVSVPVVTDVAEAMAFHPDSLLIGTAPAGEKLPDHTRQTVLSALTHGLDILSGLHFMLADDEEIRAAANAHGRRVVDVRRASRDSPIARYTPHREGSHTMLTVGTDCFAGKMTAALELNRAARRRGLNSGFLATGQTGMMIAGDGVPADRIIADFLSGTVERHVLDYTERHDWVFVEGQGALKHPYAATTALGLIHGALPDAMILCHQLGPKTIHGYPHCPRPSLRETIQINQTVANLLHPDRTSFIAGISLITHGMTESEATRAIEQVTDNTSLPATDPVRFGAEPLLDALLARLDS